MDEEMDEWKYMLEQVVYNYSPIWILVEPEDRKDKTKLFEGYYSCNFCKERFPTLAAFNKTEEHGICEWAQAKNFLEENK